MNRFYNDLAICKEGESVRKGESGEKKVKVQEGERKRVMKK